MNSERKDERDARQEQRQEQRQDESLPPGVGPPPAYPVPPVPAGDFSSVQQIVIPMIEVDGRTNTPQGRHCTGSDPGGTNSLSYTGINFTQGNALCAVFDVPADMPKGSRGWIDVYEYIDAPHERWATLSTEPFNWDGLPGWPDSKKNGVGAKFNMQVGLKHDDPATDAVGIKAGQRYYLNVSNHDPKVPKNHGSGWDTQPAGVPSV